MENTFKLDTVPYQMKELKQWILWKFEERNGKMTKIPYSVNGEKANVSNPNDWTSFDSVKFTYNAGKNFAEAIEFDGVGFVFTENDSLVGVDIDGSIDSGEYDNKTIEIIDMLDSYTELSPSGTGIHTIVQAERLVGYKKRDTQAQIECYSEGRFFTVTGDVVGGRDTINERTEELKAFAEKFLPKEEVIEEADIQRVIPRNIKASTNEQLWLKMFTSKNGKEIMDLKEGVGVSDSSAADLALCNHLAYWTNYNKEQMDSMFRESNLMRPKWDEKRGSNFTYGEATIQKAIEGTAAHAIKKMPVTKEAPKKVETSVAVDASDEISIEESNIVSFPLTELGNGQRIAHFAKGKMINVQGLDWLVWSGKRWEQDFSLKREGIINKVLFDSLEDELRVADEDYYKRLLKWIDKCGGRKNRESSMKDARHLMSVGMDKVDKYPMMFNCDNGTVNLETGELLPHNPDMLLTQISNVEYNKDADCPTWKYFLNDILVDAEGNTDESLVKYMQKAVGYSLTGDISEQVLFFLLGGGRNGKSTFTSIIDALVGEYSNSINPDTFVKKSSNGINNDIATLHASRYVYGSETASEDELSEALVKQVTGGEKVSARFLHKEYFSFVPQFKVFFATNHKPKITGNDEGIWRRIRLIPFLKDVKADEVDKSLKDKLLAELPGILNWAIEGCQLWIEEGLGLPEIIENAGNDYREEMDGTKQFMDECCEVRLNEDAGEEIKIKTTELFQFYTAWGKREGLDEILGRNKFLKALEAKGFKRVKGKANVSYILGITKKFGFNLYE